MPKASYPKGLSQASPPVHGDHRVVLTAGAGVGVPGGAGPAGPCRTDVLLPGLGAPAADLGPLRNRRYTEDGESGKDDRGERGEASTPSLSSAADLSPSRFPRAVAMRALPSADAASLRPEVSARSDRVGVRVGVVGGILGLKWGHCGQF